jgi:hypothetical protein
LQRKVKNLHNVALPGSIRGQLREVHAGASELLRALAPELRGRWVRQAAAGRGHHRRERLLLLLAAGRHCCGVCWRMAAKLLLLLRRGLRARLALSL